MTLFRHFPAKDALLLDDPFDPLMAEAVRGRPPGEPPLRALAGGIDESWREIDSAEVERLRTVLSIVVATPTLQGAIERNSARTTEALADALLDRGAAEPDAHVAAAADQRVGERLRGPGAVPLDRSLQGRGRDDDAQHRAEPFDLGAVDLAPRLIDAAGEGAQWRFSWRPAPHGLGHEGIEGIVQQQRVLGGEVAKQRHLADSRVLGDPGSRGRVIAVGEEELQRGVAQGGMRAFPA